MDLLQSVLGTGGPVLSSPGLFSYPPDTGTLTRNNTTADLPIPYNLSTSMAGGSIQGSLWTGSLVRGLPDEEGHSPAYVVVHHAMNMMPGVMPHVYRSSVMSLADPDAYFKRYTRSGPMEGATLYDLETGALNAEYRHSRGGSRMQAASETDPLAGLKLSSWAADEEGSDVYDDGGECGGVGCDDIEYELAVDFSSPVLLNAGLGSFWIGDGLGLQWSMPKGRTTGWFAVEEEDAETKEKKKRVVHVDPDRSFTWFDRQWGSGTLDFQWFQVHLPSPAEGNVVDYSTLSIWDWRDGKSGDKTFATARHASTGLDTVFPVEVVTDKTAWVSPITGCAWPQVWTIKLPGGAQLDIRSVRGDQTTPGPQRGTEMGYTGYVEVTASRDGAVDVGGRVMQQHGYGIVEIIWSKAFLPGERGGGVVEW